MILAVALGLLLLLTTPAVAQLPPNATVANSTMESRTTYTGSSGEDNIAVSDNNPPMWIFQRQDVDSALMTAGNNCNDVFADGTRIACQPTGIGTINLNAGNDRMIGGRATGMEINGGDGDDFVSPSGNAGRTIDLGDGNDTFQGGASPNTDNVNGGAGNDLLRFLAGPDDFRGGSGVDTLEVSSAGSPISISLDNVQNDGADNDFDSNVRDDVENISGAAENDSFTGDGDANVLSGGGGNDHLVGGGGQDTLNGGDADDEIEAADGEVDNIDCGGGNDKVTRDFADTAVNCETVTIADGDGDGTPPPADCDDTDASIHPGAIDVAGDGIDQDCSGSDNPNTDNDQDGVTFPTDCNDGDATIHPSAPDTPGDGVDQDCSGADAVRPPAVDADGDGIPLPADCNDASPAIKPGATDIPGNGVDENCDNRDAAFPAITSAVQNSWLAGRRRTRVAKLIVINLAGNATVTVRCAGRGCPFRTRTGRVRRGKATLTGMFKRKALRPGNVLEVRITAPGFIGKVVRYTMRRGRIPASRTLCLPPGATRPQRTC